MIRASLLAVAASLLAACFTDELPPGLSAGPQTTGGAPSTGEPASSTGAAPTTSTTASDTTGPAATTGATTLDPTTGSLTSGASTGVDASTTGDTTAVSTDGTSTTGPSSLCDAPLYATQFDAPDVGWSELTKNWTVGGGYYYTTSTLALSATWRAQESYDDVAVTAVIEAPQEGSAGLVFRANAQDIISGYYVEIDPLDQTITFGTVMQLILTPKWSADLPALQPGESVTLTAALQGGALSILVDGQIVAPGLDVAQHPRGRIGLITRNAAARFDSVQVCPL